VRRNLHDGHCGSGTGGDGGSPVDQRTTEGGQYARGRGPYIPAQSKDGWGSMGGGTRMWGMGQLGAATERQGGHALVRRRGTTATGAVRGGNFVRTPASGW
jgi:hypothetical protein